MTNEYRTIWTLQSPWQWKTVEVGLDAVVECYGWLWKIKIYNRTLAVDVVLAGLGFEL